MPPCLGRSSSTAAALPARVDAVSPALKWMPPPQRALLPISPLDGLPALSLSGVEGLPVGVFDVEDEQQLADLCRSGMAFLVSHVTATDQTVVFASNMFLELMEFQRGDVLNLNCEVLFCGSVEAQSAFAFWHCDVLAGRCIEEVVVVHTKTGRKHRVLLALTPVKGLHNLGVSHCIWTVTEVGSMDTSELIITDMSQMTEMESPKDRSRRDPGHILRNASPLPATKTPIHIPTPPSRRLSHASLSSLAGSELCSRPGSPTMEHEPAVLHVGEDGMILSCSASCMTTFGSRAQELVGKPLAALLPAPEDANVWRWGRRARLVHAVHRSGAGLRLVATAGPVETVCQRDCLPVAFENVTDMSAVQALVQEQCEALAQYKQFVSFIFHEVRQPLGVLHLGLQHIADSCHTLHAVCAETGESSPHAAALCAHDAALEDILNTVDDLAAAGQAMSRILSDVLTFEKLEERKLQVEPTLGRVEDIVLCAQHQTVSLFQAKGIHVDVEVDPRLRGVEADFDHCRLQQVLLNFLTNAQKFTPHGGDVKLSMTSIALEDDNVELKVAVEDSGVGILDAVQRQLFRPFVQYRPGQLQGGGGTGLGLAITKGIIDAHGGTIGVHSVPGHGAVFWFQLRLPRHPASPPTPSSGSRVLTPKPPTTARRTSSSRAEGPMDVLVVDDQPLNRKYLQKVIARSDYSVSVAASGEEVLQRFSSGERWRLILTDNSMGEMTGAQMIQGLLTLGCDCPIIGVTGASSPVDLQRLLCAGAKEVFQKPFQAEDVQQCLARHLRGSRTRHSDSSAPLAPPAGPFGGHRGF